MVCGSRMSIWLARRKSSVPGGSAPLAADAEEMFGKTNGFVEAVGEPQRRRRHGGHHRVVHRSIERHRVDAEPAANRPCGPDSDGVHAKPIRGLKLFLSVWRSVFGSPASAAVTNGVFGTDARTIDGTIASPSSSDTTTRPPGNVVSKFPS